MKMNKTTYAGRTTVCKNGGVDPLFDDDLVVGGDALLGHDGASGTAAHEAARWRKRVPGGRRHAPAEVRIVLSN